MTAQTRAVLKTYFQRGLRPTQTQYGDLIDSFALVSGTSTYLDTTGGAMTGSLQLRGVPVSALEAATKGYVDAIVSAGGIVIGGSNGQIQYNNAGVLGGFSVSGDATLATTGVLTLASTAVSAGTYVSPTITVDAKGRLTSATTGASGSNVATVKQQTFSASGTYTPSAGMLYCIVEAVGGGGGGGGDNTFLSSGGGGGGGYAKKLFSALTIGSSQTVTIGAAGAGNTNSAGGTGGTTTFGALLSCTGGAGGARGSNSTGVFAGGTGGTGSSGDVNISGANGSVGFAANYSGSGGDSVFGRGGKYLLSASGAGNAGIGFGAGGGGAGGGVGGAGTAGLIYITEFCSQ